MTRPNRGRTGKSKSQRPPSEYTRIGEALGVLAAEFVLLMQRIEKLEKAARAADRGTP